MGAWLWAVGDRISTSTQISGFGDWEMRCPSLQQGLRRVVLDFPEGWNDLTLRCLQNIHVELASGKCKE